MHRRTMKRAEHQEMGREVKDILSEASGADRWSRFVPCADVCTVRPFQCRFTVREVNTGKIRATRHEPEHHLSSAVHALRKTALPEMQGRYRTRSLLVCLLE